MDRSAAEFMNTAMYNLGITADTTYTLMFSSILSRTTLLWDYINQIRTIFQTPFKTNEQLFFFLILIYRIHILRLVIF